MDIRKKAVFLDKDGTLIPDIPYNIDPDLVALSEDSIEGLKKLDESGYLLFLVSNQPGVAHGLFDFEELLQVKSKLDELLAVHGIRLEAAYFCPHHPEGTREDFRLDCDCRKPKPGMLKTAALEHGILLSESWMLGDILHDVEAGKLAGCHTILIDNGNETEWDLSVNRVPDGIVKTINAAADFILKRLEPSILEIDNGLNKLTPDED